MSDWTHFATVSVLAAVVLLLLSRHAASIREPFWTGLLRGAGLAYALGAAVIVALLLGGALP